ncbi:VOC family protein [Asanoa sp. NPDC049573]|uniref:VOC family protein n=1 Tax=Asanoa sp. NPDC049573 TaxID=3155396 RepID=UPI003412E561
MSTRQQEHGGAASAVQEPTTLEVIAIPVADVDRALGFYEGLGWRLDADYEPGPRFRIVQMTPPGSACSIQLGRGVTPAAPGSAQGTYLVVSDLEQARADLISRGAEVSGIYHNVYDSGEQKRVVGPAPDGRSYASFASFTDPEATGGSCRRSRSGNPGGDPESGARST